MLGLPYFWRKKDTQPDQETITIELCKQIPELFGTDGPASIKKALKKKLEDAEKELWQIRKLFQNNLDKINKKLQPKIDALDKKTNTLKRAWEKWQAETAKKKTAYIDSNDELTAVVASTQLEAEAEEQKEKEYKRKVEREATSFKTPAAKKAKLSPPSPAQIEFLKSVLTEEQFNEYISMVGTDAEEDLDEEDQEEGGQVPMEETSPQQQQKQQENDGTTEG